MSTRTEYQEEYCGMKSGGSGGGGGNGGPTIFPDCQKSYEEQPVGGRAQFNFKQKMKQRITIQQAPPTAASRTASAPGGGRLPVYDEDFVATVYSEADRGTHRITPEWNQSKDPRWADPMRATTATLYEPADRDPPNRNNPYVYRSTLINAMDTPFKPLAVPDVHKLRYMHNDYMTHDDWY